ncbi:MAG: GNAT family N-acetyltransferase [Eubacteriaceae bacterium]|nr:GNAT family N-acetyltransferase [Eubacteriaceae bacterium]
MKEIRITDKTQNITHIRDLYETAFPENERRDLEDLIDESSEGMEFYAFYEEDVFTGILSLLTYKDITHIMYLAICEQHRGKGYGSEVLRWLKQFKKGQRIIADLERITPTAANNSQRARRNEFYIKNEFRPSGVCYSWRNEDYELYVNGGELFEHDYKNFWKHFSSKKEQEKNENKDKD